MELTSQAINEAEFSMARRGYDPDQVDEFLEKLAVAVDQQRAALEEARTKVSAAEERAAEAERRLGERPERVVDVAADDAEVAARRAELTADAQAELETLQRTLLLAQKTADAAIRDAEEEARRMIAKAEADARTAEESTRARLLQEISALDRDRAALEADVVALHGHVDEQRHRLRGTIADLERLLSDPTRLKSAAVPELSPMAPAGTADRSASDPDGMGDGAPPLVTADDLSRRSRADALAAAAMGDTDRPSRTGDDDADTVDGNLDGGDLDDAAGPARVEGGGLVDADAVADLGDAGDDADDAWARFAPDAGDDLAAGPPTQPVLRLDDLDDRTEFDDLEQDRMPAEADAEDAYLAELRKAMLEDRGAPDLEEAYRDGSSRQRFGRRR